MLLVVQERERVRGYVVQLPLQSAVLYADDAGVVSQSSEQPRKMKGVIVVVCASFGLTVSEAKTEICVYPRRGCQNPPPYSE